MIKTTLCLLLLDTVLFVAEDLAVAAEQIDRNAISAVIAARLFFLNIDASLSACLRFAIFPVSLRVKTRIEAYLLSFSRYLDK
jgi:hypothetical protein